MPHDVQPSTKPRSLFRRILFPGGRGRFAIALGVLAASLTMLYAPAALAFPHYAEIGTTRVYSTEPILPVLRDRIARADKLLATSPLYEPGLRRTLVLTDGGWRWQVMAIGNSQAVALRRPFSSILLFNRSNIAADQVANPARTLSGTIAHESVHVLTAHRFGEARLALMPRWKREGYADYVAGEPRNDAGQEQAIRARHPDAMVLQYYDSRRRVAEALDVDRQSVDALLRSD